MNEILKLNHLILVNEDERKCDFKLDVCLLKSIEGRPVAVIIVN